MQQLFNQTIIVTRDRDKEQSDQDAFSSQFKKLPGSSKMPSTEHARGRQTDRDTE